MSVGKNLQEMENVVTKGASPADPMQKVTGLTPGQTPAYEDLGGPTPDNYRPDDDSAKLRDPSQTLSQVKDVVNAKASKAKKDMGMTEEVIEDEDEDEEGYEEEEEVVAEGSCEDDAKPTKKGKKSTKKPEEEEEEEMKEDFDIEEDVNALLAGEDLSEEFQEKARTIFESAIRSKVYEIKEELQETYENALLEEVQFIKAELTERVDAYLEYVADEWISENALAVEQGLKTEMTESFLQGMKGLFEDHYVSIPEDKYDVIENMVDKLDEMEEKLNEQIERNVALNSRLAESVADVIFSDVAEGLATSQKDKLASLAETVEFDSEANYREKLAILRESYFPTRATGTQRDYSETLSESTDVQSLQPAVDGRMASYLQTLGRVAKS